MSVLICGSLAFDTIAVFPGRFSEQILPNQIHILNVSFLTPTLRREFGGCAGNIAYSLKQLGTDPIIVATLGVDSTEYLKRIDGFGMTTKFIKVDAESNTAQAFIITDIDNNQITAFHPGAMQLAHLNEVPRLENIRVAILSPDGREAMIQHAEQMALHSIPFMFDPGQGLPMFSKGELQRFVSLATWVAVNDYEGTMLCQLLELSLEELSNSHLKGIVVTLGESGCDLWESGTKTHVSGIKVSDVVDPTGCGDAFRAAVLHGLSNSWTLAECVAFGNRAGAVKLSSRGGQNHTLAGLADRSG